MPAEVNRPLAGIVVLDFGQVYQGPYATLLMAKAGADVIKIEPPHGEPLRRRAAPGKSTTLPIAMLNQNKRAITLNLKAPRGRELLFEMVRRADVPRYGNSRSRRLRSSREPAARIAAMGATRRRMGGGRSHRARGAEAHVAPHQVPMRSVPRDAASNALAIASLLLPALAASPSTVTFWPGRASRANAAPVAARAL